MTVKRKLCESTGYLQEVHNSGEALSNNCAELVVGLRRLQEEIKKLQSCGDLPQVRELIRQTAEAEKVLLGALDRLDKALTKFNKAG